MQTESSNAPQVEGGMIVDFPRQAASGADTAPARATPRPTQVRFSQYSQLTVIPNDGMKSKWISRWEKRQMERRVVIDASRMRDLFRNLPPDMVTQDDLYECVGIEPFLSEDLGRQRLERRRAHVEAVLLAQRAHQGACKVKKISQASERSSRLGRESAENLAKLYATQLR
jgi:hypothetical protein